MTVREAEDQIRRQHFETAIAWNAQGIEILRKDGEQYQVVFSDEEIASMKGAILTHNHPRGLAFARTDMRSWGNSFSDIDLHLACAAQLSELRVVTPRLRFWLKPPNGGWDEAYWENSVAPSYARHDDVVSHEFVAAIEAGHLSAEEAESRFFHEVCLRLSLELGLDYVREES